MKVLAWPAGPIFRPTNARLQYVHTAQRVNESPLSGAVQTRATPGARWAWELDFPAQMRRDRERLEAFLLSLDGRVNRVLMFDFFRARPRGTCAVQGVTIDSPAAPHAEVVSLAGCGAGASLAAGDWIGLQTGQLVMSVGPATADAAGRLTATVFPMLRRAVPAGAAVTLLQPTARYMRTESALTLPRTRGESDPGFTVGFVEAFP